MIAVEHPDAVWKLAQAPGSVLKPFFLSTALREGRVRAQTTVECRGNLRIAGRDVACTHPRAESVFDAEQALAYSCNEWFAQLALRFTPQQAAEVLRGYGFGSRTGLMADEATGLVREPRNAAETQLLVLGLDGVKVTPAQLARGYRKLTQQRAREPVVERGLVGSVEYGMAHNAATAGLLIAGKTGTASDAGEAWTHGWFVGMAERTPSGAAKKGPAESRVAVVPQATITPGGNGIVVVFLVPHGNGADAARMAHRYFALWAGAAP